MAITLIIRGISAETGELLSARARDAGFPSRESWLKAEIERLALSPSSPPSYRLRCYGPEGAFASIRRLDSGSLEIGAGGLSDTQVHAYQGAQSLIRQNVPGDREKAIGILQAVFEVVLLSF